MEAEVAENGDGGMVCIDLLSKDARKRLNRGEQAPAVVVPQRFIELHEQGQRLIRGWAQRASMEANCEDEHTFEPFIFAWIAVNGWACCVTKEDHDSAYLDALLLDQALEARFAELLEHEDFAKAANNFRALWPIFSSKDLGYNFNQYTSRAEAILEYRNSSPGAGYKPACAFRHRQAIEDIPLDWAHTLCAIYQVRCNLFHGYKGIHRENDVAIVARSFRVLVRLLPILFAE